MHLSRRPSRRGFTLMEVMIGVAILAMVTSALYQFVGSTLNVARVSRESADSRADLAGLNRVLQSLFSSLPRRSATGGQPLAGKAGRGAGGRADGISWIALPGQAIFARRAEGLFLATLELAPSTRENKHSALVLSRSSYNPEVTTANAQQFASVRLLEDVSSLEIAYYDARINSWVDDWKEAEALPDLVRFRLSFSDGRLDYELVVSLPPRSQRNP